MLNFIVSKIKQALSGNFNDQLLLRYSPIVERINSLEPEIAALSDTELQAKTSYFRELIAKRLEASDNQILIPDDVPRMPGQIRNTRDRVLSEVLEEIAPEAFAVCREASRRVLQMRHFDVQLIGGLQLHHGGIAEMQTGEGKTLVCTLPAYLNALTGRGVHIVTVNDYLARRDSEWMGKLYKFLGLSVGLVIHSVSPSQRREAYACDICYGTNNEFGFDYLRDNMETKLSSCVQRSYWMAIVDEVDSILIDEARTPLVISGFPDINRQGIYKTMSKLAETLSKGLSEKDLTADYHVDEKTRNVILTDAGIHRAEQSLKVPELWDPNTNLAHHLIQAIKAKELFSRDVDYIVKDNPETKRKEVVIVDEFTGRLMEGRRWGDGLHQAVEAKEGVQIQEETLTMASITFQNLFRLYPKLAGMTGTAATEAEEFAKIYNLPVLVIPTNKHCVRKNLNDIVFKNEKSKYFAVVEDIVRANWLQRPVLVGTTSIDKSEYIANLLSKPIYALQILESRLKRFLKQVEKHKLQEQISSLLPKLDRPANLRLIDLLSFFAAPLGSSEGLLSSHMRVDEDNMVHFLLADVWTKDEELKFAVESLLSVLMVLDKIRSGLQFSVLNAKHHEKEAHIIRQAGKLSAITIATNMAGRGTDIVLGGFLSSDPNHVDFEKIDSQAQAQIQSLGGLHVIGTERHESRRIDNQLRGRCARQGDPGSARFYLSLEDSLMRIFGGDKIIAVMNLLKADEDLPIEATMVSGAINNAQKKVEAHHFDIRKHVLQYDDVINTQREVIYRERRSILEGEDIHESVLRMFQDRVKQIVYAHMGPDDPVETWFTTDEHQPISHMAQVFELLKVDFSDLFFGANVVRVKDASEFIAIYKSYDNFLLVLEQAALELLARKEQEVGTSVIREAERQIMLHVIDSKWIEHIHSMDSLKDGIHLQSYGQKDPLIEYKKEAFAMFEDLLASVRKDLVALLAHAQIIPQTAKEKAPSA